MAIADRARRSASPPASSRRWRRAPGGTTRANVFALWGLSTPNFWLGILLILLFSVQLGWLPASGYVSPFEDLKANLAAMIMPAFVLGNAIAAVLMRHTRSAMLQVLSSDYVRTARAKGLDERVVVLKHALRNALIADHHARRARVRHAAVRRGADRAGVHHPGLRQADRRRGVQPRLRGGAGRGAVHRDGYIMLNLLADIAYFRQPEMRAEASRLERSRLDDVRPAAHASTSARGEPWRRALRACAGAARWSAWSSSCSSSRSRCSRRGSRRTTRSRRAGARSARRRRAAHWFGTDEIGRDVLSRVDLGRARLAARRRGVGVDLAARSACRSACRGLRRRLGRRADLAHHRRDARLPVPDPRDRARRVPRARA